VWRKIDASSSSEPSITVLTPIDMSTYFLHLNYTVSWRPRNIDPAATVKLVLYHQKYHPSEYVITIIASTPAVAPSLSTGNYTWALTPQTLPPDFLTGDFYRIAVVWCENPDVVGLSPGAFRILSPVVAG